MKNVKTSTNKITITILRVTNEVVRKMDFFNMQKKKHAKVIYIKIYKKCKYHNFNVIVLS